MKIVKQNYRCKCGINDCTANADYCIDGEGVVPLRRINMCSACAEKLLKELEKALRSKEVRNDKSQKN